MRTNLSIAIEKIANVSKVSRNPKDIIDDIISYCFLSCHKLPSPFHSFAFNPEFIDYVKSRVARYDERTFPLLKDAALVYQKEIANAEPFTDIIGSQYDEYLGKCLGQFLTPPDVAETCFMFSMLPYMETKIEQGEHFGVMDPCVGAGALILPALRHAHKLNGLRYVHITVNDIDPAMCLMCAMQLYLPAVIHQTAFGSLLVTNGDAITEYQKEKPVFCAIKNHFDYSIYRANK